MTFIAPQEKLFAHLDRLAEIQQAGTTSAPLNCEIDLSNRCSLGCEWCHFAFTHTRGPLAGKRDKPAGAVLGGDLMPVELAHKIVDELAIAGVKSITWTGGGEPTLHPHFDHIIEYTAKAGVRQGIYTHGGHINDDRAALLKKHLTFVYVSLDAADPVTYKRDKGVDRFAAACDGISRLVAADGDATVGVGYLVTESNWRNAGAAAELVKTLGADYVQFRPTIHYTQDDPGTPAEDVGWLGEATAYLETLVGPGVEADIDRFRMYQRWGGHGYHTCWWSTLQTCITPNGKVWACVNKREHPAAELGDLSRESFAELWWRHKAVPVTADCRVMCRGHLANQMLDSVMAPREHPEFV